MTQMEILIKGLAQTFAFPLAAVVITAVVYGLTRKSSWWTSL